MTYLLAFIYATVMFYVAVVAASAAPSDKVTICHAAGLAGTTHYVELTISYNAAFGQAGHFYENGTPRAGHEQDYLGQCAAASTPTPSAAPTPSPTPEATPVVPTETATPTPSIQEVPTPTPQIVGTSISRGPIQLPNTGGTR